MNRMLVQRIPQCMVPQNGRLSRPLTFTTRMSQRGTIQQRRTFLNLPNILVPPVVFTGLFVSLWIWKCCMMVVFQNKIIYMPGLPPNARSETIADYESQCGGIEWREERTRSADGTQISLCVAHVDSGIASLSTDRVYILYFQGHSSSLLQSCEL